VLTAVGVAAASPQLATTFEMTYLSQEPSAATGLEMTATWTDPGELGGKPAAIKRIALKFASGTTFDTSALPTCEASDDAVKRDGAAACPAASRLGTGSTEGVLVPGVPFATNVTLFNAKDQIIVLVTYRGVTITEFRDDVKRDEIDVSPAPPPGVALQKLHIHIDSHSSGTGAQQKAWMRTPATCPKRGAWTTIGRFTFADGSTQTRESGSPCTASPASTRAISLSVRPRTVAAGRRVRFRFHATTAVGGQALAVGAATIRFAGRRTRTDARGSATIVARLIRPGRYVAGAAKAGLRSAQASVRVV
jgi:hypothetical protein